MVIVELIGAALLLAVLGVLVLVLRAVTNPVRQPSPQPVDVTRPAAAGAAPDPGPDRGEARGRGSDAVPGAGPGHGTDEGAVAPSRPAPDAGAGAGSRASTDRGADSGVAIRAGAGLASAARQTVVPGAPAVPDAPAPALPPGLSPSGQDRERRADLERREARLAERERRLDDERLRLDARAAAAAEAEQRSVVAARLLGDREAEAKRARAEVGLERERMRTALESEAWEVRAELAADARLARAELEARRVAAAAELQRERTKTLEHVAQLTTEAAREELLHTIEHAAKREAALTVRQLEAEARELGEQRARSIVADAVQRVASEQTAESVVSVLHLPSDDMKGRIIGREGRNIRAFESLTGVNVVIDDTPEAVLLSCFDPVRREVGRRTLEALVLDGRIQPQRIEELYERSKAEVEAGMVRSGEDALLQVGITDVHPDLVALLGRLRYRTSYGQNVLKHLIETAHIAGMMAAELRLDPATTKRGAFFHDIGKALGHEVEGSHASIGADLARRYGEADEVVHAIEAHHGEVAAETIEAVLTQASDSCSGGRPGARRESLESYVQRLHRIEEIASTRPGVDKVFAMQAGREVRVMVLPDEVDDLGALVLAREVAKQIEDELTYPGQIRVTVVRESRATEIAH